MQKRRAKREDIDGINRLTLQMHNHLGKMVGITFSAEDMEDEFFDESEGFDEVYVAEVNRRVVGYLSFAERIREDE